MILHGDSLHELKNIASDSIDFICTDPPYGYSFMGKDWDKAVPSVEIWAECCRVLKPGGFACVMSAPRSDVQQAMVERLIQGGFRLDFTPIYWTYSTGFPKAGNTTKILSKRGLDAPQFAGSYAGFQPKPSVEVILVCMKPLSEKTYVDQALANGHGISWLDDARMPTDQVIKTVQGQSKSQMAGDMYQSKDNRVLKQFTSHEQGRFPANLIVSDDVLNDYSRYFDLDKWAKHKLGEQDEFNTRSDSRNTEMVTGQPDGQQRQQSPYEEDTFATLPFLISPKASKSEKNKGLDAMPKKLSGSMIGMTGGGSNPQQTPHKHEPRANHHPTVKPLKLMSYLITLFSREGDIVLDPFVGSGTTCVAADKLGRENIGIEREAEYVEIAKARLADRESELDQVSLL